MTEAAVVEETIESTETVEQYTAADHRRHARHLMVGKKGLSDAEKIERVERAYKHLGLALEKMKDGDAAEA